MVSHDSEIMTIYDLEEKKLGIAGGSIDKSWLLFRAYLKKNTGKDGKRFVKPIFVAPPLLNKLIIKNENVPEAEDGYIYIIDLVGSENASDS